MALIEKLNNIGDAIRTKTETAEKLSLDEMPEKILGIQGGSVTDYIPEDAFVLSGDLSGYFSRNKFAWFLKLYGNRITTEDITGLASAFDSCRNLDVIPFDLNCNNTNSIQLSNLFVNCSNLEKIGNINNAKINGFASLFQGCNRLRELPQFVNCDFQNLHTSSGSTMQCFYNCYSLREIPSYLLKELYSQNNSIYSHFFQNLNGCYVLDELINIPLYESTTFTSNGFKFSSCLRLKNITFALKDDNTAKIENWKNQNIDISNNIGYASSANSILNYNSGITADKEVTDDASYQALKNDKDWFTCNVAYSRYNHDSAVATINSLPDTSAYLAANGGTNTIKFTGAAGSATDGGAINTLTAEEIAVAAAKGWTVSIV